MAAPSGTVTMLFSDIEGSTRLLQRLGHDYSNVLATHQRLMRDAFGARGGHEEGTEGDSFFVLFERAADGLDAALEAQRAIVAYEWPPEAAVRVRMGLHTGDVLQAGGQYVGMSIHEAARIGAAGHGGQILISSITRELAGAPPDGASYRDLGEHWLKDLATPQHLFQVQHPDLPSEFGPIRSSGSTPHNLPAQTTTLVGRERETQEVTLLLRDNRAVTITGAGGAGKSRLAVRVGAEMLSTFGHGVWLVELAPHIEANAVADALGTSIGLRKGSSIDDIAAFLRARNALVIIDNCEHLIEPAAEVAHELLRSCANVTVLATSREPLGLPGEVAWRLPSLSLPSPDPPPSVDELARYEAIELFCERAHAADRRFALTAGNAETVTQICRQLDGIPLALELAAARAGALGVDQLAARLDQRFRLLTGGSRVGLARQRTLRATVDWSYELLSAQERLLLRRVGVFVGGWTLDAAVAVCSDDALDELDVIDLLSQLLSKSLVLVEETDETTRYRLLETIRQYALDRLLEHEELETARNRHLAWCLRLATDTWDAALAGEPDEISLHPLERELENIRSAIDWAQDSDPLQAEALVSNAVWLWFTGGRAREGHRRAKAAIEATPKGPRLDRVINLETLALTAPSGAWESILPPTIDEVRELLTGCVDGGPRTAFCAASAEELATRLAQSRGEDVAALVYAEKGLEVARASGDPSSLNSACVNLSFALSSLARFAEARSALEESLDICRRCGWRVNESRTLIYMTQLSYQSTGVVDRALAEDALRGGRDTRDPMATAAALQFLGIAASVDNDFPAAVSFLEESLAEARRFGMTSIEAMATTNLGWYRYLVGDLEGGKTRTEEALVKHRDAGASALSIAEAQHSLGEIARARGDLGEARRLLVDVAQVGLDEGANGEALCAECLDSLGGLAAALGKGETAAVAFAVAEARWPAAVPRHAAPQEREILARDIALAREIAGDAFDATYEASRELSLAEAVARVEADLSG